MNRNSPNTRQLKASHLLKSAVLIFSTILFLTGCSYYDRLFLTPDTPPAGQSLIYFYRPLDAVDDNPDPGIYLNGMEILDRMPKKTYWAYAIPPGTYTFSANFPMYGSLPLTLENKYVDALFFVEVGYEYGAPDRFTLYLSGLSENDKPKAIEGCFRIDR